jgi:hypothetical protein
MTSFMIFPIHSFGYNYKPFNQILFSYSAFSLFPSYSNIWLKNLILPLHPFAFIALRLQHRILHRWFNTFHRNTLPISNTQYNHHSPHMWNQRTTIAICYQRATTKPTITALHVKPIMTVISAPTHYVTTKQPSSQPPQLLHILSYQPEPSRQDNYPFLNTSH